MPSYNASCHCHYVRLSFETDHPLEDQELIICNCEVFSVVVQFDHGLLTSYAGSICTKNGYINVYPEHERVKILRGEDVLKVRDSPLALCRQYMGPTLLRSPTPSYRTL